MRKLWVRLPLVVWGVIVLLLGSAMMVDHWAPLPLPAPADPAVVRAVARSRRPAEVGEWLALHVLYADCPCSQRIFAHVLHQTRPRDVMERIVLIGDSEEMKSRAEARGFTVESVPTQDLAARYGMVAAPALLVSAPDDSIRYLGGYTNRKQGPEIQDVALIRSAVHNNGVLAALPLFGCAVSRSLQETLDPLGLKY